MTRNALLLASIIALCLVGRSGHAFAATYHCLPIDVVEKPDYLRVQCAEPVDAEGGYPRDGSARIRFFAVPKTNLEFATRLQHLAETALVSGLIVRFLYTSGDTSGSAFGCGTSNCRKPTAFGLLAPSANVRIPYAELPSATAEAIDEDEWRQFGPFSISEVRKLVVTMTGTGDADLYVRKDLPPTETDYDCRPYGGTSNESCTMTEKATYFIGVHGYSAHSTFKLVVTVQAK